MDIQLVQPEEARYPFAFSRFFLFSFFFSSYPPSPVLILRYLYPFYKAGNSPFYPHGFLFVYRVLALRNRTAGSRGKIKKLLELAKLLF